MKDVNNLVVTLLHELDQHSDRVGEATVNFLKAQTADARKWPTDLELITELPTIKAYGNIKQPRLRSVFAGIELQLRTQRHENITLPERLAIEHVMPQGWRNHWGADVAGDQEATARREALVNTLGNLTLVTSKLNGALSNRPWTDAEAENVAPSGKDAGKGKRSLLGRYSLLMLNKDVVEQHESAWRDEDITERSRALAKTIAATWPAA
jgi:hypothetical protein